MKAIYTLLLVASALLSCQRTPAIFPAPDVQETPSAYEADAGAPKIFRYRGVNLSGAEFGTAIPGEPGKDYQYPDPSDVEYFQSLPFAPLSISRPSQAPDRASSGSAGMNHIRLPFRWERLQPHLRGALVEAEWKRLAYVVDYATKKGMGVTLAPFGGFRHGADPELARGGYGKVVSEAEIADFWGRVAARFKDNPLVSINITNEPHDMPTETVAKLDNAAIAEIRAVGFQGMILAPGGGWTGGGHWGASWYGTPNAVAMTSVGVGDPNVVFEVHQYLDDKANGTGDCVSADIGVTRLSGFTAWLRKEHRKGFLGEFAGINTPTCKEAVTRMLTYVEANADVFVGWLWFGAGVWSFGSTYPLSIGPSDPPKPQLFWLLPFLKRP